MAVQKVANNPLGSYPVLVDQNSSGSGMQVVRLDLGSGPDEERAKGSVPVNITDPPVYEDTYFGTGKVLGIGKYLLDSNEWTVFTGEISGTVSITTASTGILSTVSVTTSSTPIAALDYLRVGLIIVNTHATSTLYIAYGTTASSSKYSTAIAPGQREVVPQPFVRLKVEAVSSTGTINACVSTGS